MIDALVRAIEILRGTIAAAAAYAIAVPASGDRYRGVYDPSEPGFCRFPVCAAAVNSQRCRRVLSEALCVPPSAVPTVHLGSNGLPEHIGTLYDVWTAVDEGRVSVEIEYHYEGPYLDTIEFVFDTRGPAARLMRVEYDGVSRREYIRSPRLLAEAAAALAALASKAYSVLRESVARLPPLPGESLLDCLHIEKTAGFKAGGTRWYKQLTPGRDCDILVYARL